MVVLGNSGLLNTKLAVVLNSSQSKTPCGGDTWVKATSEAVKYLVGSNLTIVTSLSLNTWELTAYLVSRFNGNQIIVSPETDDSKGQAIFDNAVMQFRLDPRKTAMVFVKPENGSKKTKSSWPKRDLAAVSLAGVILPVSIRPDGRLRRLIDDNAAGKELESRFTVEFRKSIIAPRRYSRDDLVVDIEKWDFLTHWTRTCHGPWPGQSKFDYYQSLVDSGADYPNNALNTLNRIIDEKTIRGSSKRIRDSRSVIAFTESLPSQVLSRIRWLPKRSGWNFEPYAIAIHKRVAAKLGVKPVFYGNSEVYEALPAEKRPYFQSIGEKNVDWREEKEWRCLGDFDLTPVSPDNIALIVPSEAEAEILRNTTEFGIFPAGLDGRGSAHH